MLLTNFMEHLSTESSALTSSASGPPQRTSSDCSCSTGRSFSNSWQPWRQITEYVSNGFFHKEIQE